MDIIRNDDGSLTVPVVPSRHANDDDPDTATGAADGSTQADGSGAPETRVLSPGQGGYIEALAEWDRQRHPDGEVAVSTASGREGAMAVIHAVSEDPEHVAEAVEALDDPGASAEALRHVLVGGNPSVQAFASEVAEAEGGDPLPPHKATRIIGEVLAEIEARLE